MSEKRFSVRLRSECDGVIYSFFDGDKPLDVDMIVNKLNEQQDHISKLQANVEYLIDSKKELIEKINKQQATINKQKRRIEVLENLLTNMGVKWVGDDE